MPEKRSVSISVRIWPKRNRDGTITIKIASTKKLISAVENVRTRARYHPNLFSKTAGNTSKEGKVARVSGDPQQFVI